MTGIRVSNIALTLRKEAGMTINTWLIKQGGMPGAEDTGSKETGGETGAKGRDSITEREPTS